jgi:hypothetical protein
MGPVTILDLFVAMSLYHVRHVKKEASRESRILAW